MNLTVHIPDEIVGSLGTGVDSSRRVLEAFALEEFKSERISKAQLRSMLGFETRYELDGFLKDHQVWAKFTIEDLRREVSTLQRLGF
jgi:hypothetical protein